MEQARWKDINWMLLVVVVAGTCLRGSSKWPVFNIGGVLFGHLFGCITNNFFVRCRYTRKHDRVLALNEIEWAKRRRRGRGRRGWISWIRKMKMATRGHNYLFSFLLMKWFFKFEKQVYCYLASRGRIWKQRQNTSEHVPISRILVRYRSITHVWVRT